VLWLGEITCLVLLATGDPPAATQSTTAPAAFQPGVWIDWRAPAVHVQTRVVLRAGALEFLACWPGKEHESIVRCDAAATHVYLALGLIGVQPGHPPRWNPETGTFAPPAGGLVDIAFTWEEDGRKRTADAYEWLREVEYGRSPLPRPWIFAGSLRTAAGGLATDQSGVGVALVDFADSLLCFSRRYPSRYGALWATAHTAALPPLDTPVRMVLRPARPRPRVVVLDARGVVWLDGRYGTLADLADVIGLERRLDPGYVQVIDVTAALRSDVRRLREGLRAAGVPADAVRLEGGAAIPQAEARPPGVPPHVSTDGA
jgi:hypothetical protein